MTKLDARNHPQLAHLNLSGNDVAPTSEPIAEIEDAVDAALNANLSILFIPEDFVQNLDSTIGSGSAVALNIDGHHWIASASHVLSDAASDNAPSDETRTLSHEGKEYATIIDSRGNIGFARLVTFGCDDICKARTMDDSPSDIAILEPVAHGSEAHEVLRTKLSTISNEVIDEKLPDGRPVFREQMVELAEQLKDTLGSNQPLSYESIDHVLIDSPHAKEFHGFSVGTAGDIFNLKKEPAVAYHTFVNDGFDDALQPTGTGEVLNGESRSMPLSQPGMSGGGAYALIKNDNGTYDVQWAGVVSRGGIGLLSSYTPAHKVTGVINTLIAAEEFQGKDVFGLEGFSALDDPTREDWIGMPPRDSSLIER